MIIEIKTFELEQRKVAEYIRVKAPFRWQVDLSDVACFIYWLNGKNTLYVADEHILTSGKDALLLKCGAYIDQVFPCDAEEVAAVIVHFYPDLLKDLFKNEIPETFKESAQQKQSLPVKLEQNELLAKYIDNLLFYFKHPELADKDLLSLKIKELILLLGKTHQRQTLEQILKQLFAPQAVSFQAVVEAQLYSGLSLRELAYLTQRSITTFKRDFQKYYKMSPGQYIRSRKLEKAARLLSDTSLHITAIAFECGFINLSHFTRLFHHQYKLSPTAYRMSRSVKFSG